MIHKHQCFPAVPPEYQLFINRIYQQKHHSDTNNYMECEGETIFRGRLQLATYVNHINFGIKYSMWIWTCLEFNVHSLIVLVCQLCLVKVETWVNVCQVSSNAHWFLAHPCPGEKKHRLQWSLEPQKKTDGGFDGCWAVCRSLFFWGGVEGRKVNKSTFIWPGSWKVFFDPFFALEIWVVFFWEGVASKLLTWLLAWFFMFFFVLWGIWKPGVVYLVPNNVQGAHGDNVLPSMVLIQVRLNKTRSNFWPNIFVPKNTSLAPGWLYIYTCTVYVLYTYLMCFGSTPIHRNSGIFKVKKGMP